MNDLSRKVSSAGRILGEASNRIRHVEEAIFQSSSLDPTLFQELKDLEVSHAQLSLNLYGDRVRQRRDIAVEPAIMGRLNQVIYGLSGTSLAPTQTHRENVEIAEKDFAQFMDELIEFSDRLESYESQVQAAGAPYTPGRKLYE